MHVLECSMWAYAIGFVLHGSSTIEDSDPDSKGHPQQIHTTNATSLLRLLRLVNLFDCQACTSNTIRLAKRDVNVERATDQGGESAGASLPSLHRRERECRYIANSGP